MSITTFNQLVENARHAQKQPCMVVAVAQEEHTLAAVAQARRDGICESVLVGDAVRIREILARLGEDAASYRIVDEPTLEGAVATSMRLVNEGGAELLMKGILETRDLMHAVVAREGGLRTGRRISHFALFEVPGYHKLVAISDVVVNTTPDLKGKRSILQNAVECLHALGYESPKVACLSSGEEVNPSVPSSADMAELKRLNQTGEIGGCVVEGPISLDLALSGESARIKGYESPVAGDADLLVVPDIVSGNLLSKSLLLFGGAQTAAYVCGAKVPIVLTSRSATVQDKYNSIALAALAVRK